MAKARTLVLGVGCLLVLLATVMAVLFAVGLSEPALSRQVLLAVRLGGPIPEIVAEDPLAELTAGQVLSLRDYHEALTRAAADDRVQGVRLRIDSVGGGVATGQELRGLVQKLRTAGKWTSAYLDTAGEFAPGNFVYYLASACDEVSLNPMGEVNLIGLSARAPFMRGTFDKLGVKPEWPGRGEYKTARFFYTERGFTPANREMLDWLLDSLMDQLAGGIAESRKMAPEAVRELIDQGPFCARDAVDANLVDHLEDWHDFALRTAGRVSDDVEVIGLRNYLRRSEPSRGGAKIGVVTAVGTIMRGSSGKSINPMLGDDIMGIMGSDTIARAFRNLRATRGIKAVVLRVDSGGGSVLASEIIRQEVQRTAEKLPLVVSMSNAAASGAYWITCGAQKVVANPGTFTGSIGVYAGHLNMDRFWEDKIGITFGRLDRGTNANLYGSLEDWTDSQRAVVNQMLDRVYDLFLQRVGESRGMTVDAVDAVGRGRVFTGSQAAENGLVDEIGGFDRAVELARELAGIDPDATVQLVDYPKILPWWSEMVRRRRDEEAAVRETADLIEQVWRTGQMPLPGLAWMPPVYVR
jgi:protease-4